MMRVNGVSASTISLRDRGLAYGDGVFRTIRCENGRPLFWHRHWSKLQSDARVLGIDPGAESVWLNDIQALVSDNGVLKLMLTRGESLRGYAVNSAVQPQRIAQFGPLPAYPERFREEGVAVRWCEWPLSTQPRLAGVKHLNRLDNVMARREWQSPEIFEGLMTDLDGHVIEGVMTNLFVRRGRFWSTPRLDQSGVSGVGREVLMALLAGDVSELRLNRSDVLAADEVLLVNSVAGIVPVREIEGRQWSGYQSVDRLWSAWLELQERECNV